ncbi:MAG TPA: imidazoleglycerol-phosphate dehydratase [Nitrososphaerales archaeon]|nr:imidazoleglycerol-phosphate dehydratase [Nitrososphaerales archaeon]
MSKSIKRTKLHQPKALIRDRGTWSSVSNSVTSSSRIAQVEAQTKETKTKVRVNVDGTGKSRVTTGTKFLDHMIAGFSTHSLIDVEIEADGDLKHHIIEDTALALGRCISNALGERKGIVRFGSAYAPMDESLAFASVDLVKRTYFVSSGVEVRRSYVEDLPKEDLLHFFRSLCDSLQCTMHLRVEYGTNDHHKVEACFKALALALRRAMEADPRRMSKAGAELPSSKGKM